MKPKSEQELINKNIKVNVRKYCSELLKIGFDVKLIKWNSKFVFTYASDKQDKIVYNEIKKRNKLFNFKMHINFIISKIKETPFLQQVNNI